MALFETYTEAAGTGGGGMREDLLDVIVNISPTETPMQSAFKKSKAVATTHEWLTDTLGTADASRVAEGAAFSNSANVAVARTRLSNYTQINREVFEVSDTMDAVDKAGIKGGEYEYQLARALKILALAMETDIVNGASAAGAAGTPRGSKGVIPWTTSNVDTAGGGRDLTEAIYNNSLQAIFVNGGNPDTTYVHGTQKRAISGFSASSQRNIEATAKKLVYSVDVYESDFGLQRVILDRHMITDKLAQLQKDMWGIAMLRPVKHTPIAKLGASRAGMVEAEWTVVSYEEKASGIIEELNV